MTSQNVNVTTSELDGRLVSLRRSRSNKSLDAGRTDWTAWPTYDAAALGFRNWWYPVQWSSQVGEKPQQVELCGEKVAIVRDGDKVFALHDRCPHRGVPLSQGTKEFPATMSCPYHGWTYRLSDGELVAVITDGPESPICGKVSVKTYPVEERLGLVWIFIGDEEPHSIDAQLPEELTQGDKFTMGGRLQDRPGNWRYACENGYDEGHAKFLHRTSWWRAFKVMPTWNRTHIERHGRWLYRVQDEVAWEADFPGVGHWTNNRWYKIKPPAMKNNTVSNIGNTGGAASIDPVIKRQGFPGFASVSLPGVLRIAYPQFIHYEFYVPIDATHHKYVGVMVQFKTGLAGWWYRARYVGGIRWLFHGNFSNQDKWMVELTDCPPERLYRPDNSLIAWRRLCENGERPNGLPNRVVGVDVLAAATAEPEVPEERAVNQ
jgi:phenylpropionate dioxygenase-like ring-hydroxylating dioxygenase large terminal subunit